MQELRKLIGKRGASALTLVLNEFLGGGVERFRISTPITVEELLEKITLLHRASRRPGVRVIKHTIPRRPGEWVFRVKSRQSGQRILF
jgi:hypothetical protein